MINMNNLQLTALDSQELQQTEGGGWPEFVFRFLLSEFDDIARGLEDSVSGKGYHYK